jgi:serine/threonine protein kinase
LFSHADRLSLFFARFLALVYADEIVKEAGTGTFGRVLLCKDRKHSGRLVAVKAVRRIPKYVEAAKIEASIISDVNTRDIGNESLCVKYYRSMEWQRHFFIVTEPLGKSLYDFIKANNYKPLPLYCVQSFADQLLTAVSFLHGMRLVHTDLKPENILLVKRDPFTRSRSLTCTRDGSTSLAPASTAIRLIDFGGATYDECRKSSLINTRQYRAPEVILGQTWSLASDIWSIGCILMELYTGRLLFSTHDSFEHLALMENCLGKFPVHMRTGGNASKYFHRSTGTLRYWDKPDAESLAHVTRMRKLELTVHPRDNVFLKFIRSLLQYDPAKRITAAQALNDQLFRSVRGSKSPPAVGPPPSTGARTGKKRPMAASAAASAATPAASAPAAAAAASASATSAGAAGAVRRGSRRAADAAAAAAVSVSASGAPPRIPASSTGRAKPQTARAGDPASQDTGARGSAVPTSSASAVTALTAASQERADPPKTSSSLPEPDSRRPDSAGGSRSGDQDGSGLDRTTRGRNRAASDDVVANQGRRK